jgi:hypothetical protein
VKLRQFLASKRTLRAESTTNLELRKTPRINWIGLLSAQVNSLKKTTQFEVVPLSEVLTKARPIGEAEPAAEAAEAPPEPAKSPERTQRRLPGK